jgi:hypothetical protein
MVGTFGEWVERGLSDHIPLVVDVDLETIREKAHDDSVIKPLAVEPPLGSDKPKA